jgi:hypothetical protein
MIVVTVETRPVVLRLPHQKGCMQGALKNLRIILALHCYSTNSSANENGDSDVELLLFLTPFTPPIISFVSFMSL